MAGVGPYGREQPDDLGRVQDAAAAGRDDPPRALVERLQRFGRRVADLDDDALADEGEEAQHAVAHHAVGLAQASADEHVLDPEAEA